MNPYYVVIIASLGVFFAAVVVIENTAKMTFRKISVAIIAVIIGLIIGALLASPLSKLPGLWGELMPLSISIISAFAMIILFNRNEKEIELIVDLIFKGLYSNLPGLSKEEKKPNDIVCIDSSALIDGRLIEIVKSGFLNSQIVIPKFILNELQQIADSKDSARRALGRRGLDAVTAIRRLRNVRLTISEVLLEKSEAADHKLIDISKKLGADLITTDYNLNKLAEAQGVRVLNINELAKGLRISLMPDQELEIKIVHVGKDRSQGVGYSEDGTMIVVDNGLKKLDSVVKVRIIRALQTTAGKMYFARIVEN